MCRQISWTFPKSRLQIGLSFQKPLPVSKTKWFKLSNYWISIKQHFFAFALVQQSLSTFYNKTLPRQVKLSIIKILTKDQKTLVEWISTWISTNQSYSTSSISIYLYMCVPWCNNVDVWALQQFFPINGNVNFPEQDEFVKHIPCEYWSSLIVTCTFSIVEGLGPL